MAVSDDRRKLDSILKALRGPLAVDVGVFDPEVAVYAAVHEYGTSDATTPARRWLTKGIEDNGMPVESAMAAAGTALVSGKRPEDVMGDLGADVADIVRAHLNSANFPPPLKADTVKRKGHSKQLVHTGKMRDAIDHKVVK